MDQVKYKLFATWNGDLMQRTKDTGGFLQY